MGDLSVLSPMSLQDLIWVEAEAARTAVERCDGENAKFKYFDRRMADLEMALCDLREIARLDNFYIQIAALKGGRKMPKITMIKDKDLPSFRIRKAIEEGEKTDEQRQKEHDEYIHRLIQSQKNEEMRDEIKRRVAEKLRKKRLEAQEKADAESSAEVTGNAPGSNGASAGQ